MDENLLLIFWSFSIHCWCLSTTTGLSSTWVRREGQRRQLHLCTQPGLYMETSLTPSSLCDSVSSFLPSFSSSSFSWPSCSPVSGGGEGGNSTIWGSYSLASTSVTVKDWPPRLVPDRVESCTVECSCRSCAAVFQYHKRVYYTTVDATLTQMVLSFPGLPTVQFLIACSMQKRRGEGLVHFIT